MANISLVTTFKESGDPQYVCSEHNSHGLFCPNVSFPIQKKFIKMESTLFVSTKLIFSENLRCLNLVLMVGVVSHNRSLYSTCFVIAGQSIHIGEFKHLEYSENDNFEVTNSVDSILT